jgi:hypothetical protein
MFEKMIADAKRQQDEEFERARRQNRNGTPTDFEICMGVVYTIDGPRKIINI